MSEQSKPRTLDDIRAEYQNLCSKAGHLQYQIHALSDDLELTNKALRDLNLEAAALPKEEAPSEAK